MPSTSRNVDRDIAGKKSVGGGSVAAVSRSASPLLLAALWFVREFVSIEFGGGESQTFGLSGYRGHLCTCFLCEDDWDLFSFVKMIGISIMKAQ